jgi:hypothetical protein
MSDRAEPLPKPSKRGSQKRQRSKLAALPCTAAERGEIEARAERAGLSVAGYLRVLVFGQDTPQPRAARRPALESAELTRLRYELRKIGGNLNQIAHRLNQGREVEPRLLAAVCAEHGTALRAILTALGRGGGA